VALQRRNIYYFGLKYGHGTWIWAYSVGVYYYFSSFPLDALSIRHLVDGVALQDKFRNRPNSVIESVFKRQ
jgi:hypothetical protein